MNHSLPQEMWLIPHTHWDREWYEPHDVFRHRLVAMMDELLNVLDAVPEYRFTLDGQSAAVEDYLELRPERTDQVRAAVERGQLAIGPFQILLDEFSSDGETTIRNLELGIQAARKLGGEMRVGYLPDMFGHAAQTPQILCGFGLTDACVWRGVPAAVDKHAFVWEALDGSQVRVEYQWDGYGNALKLFDPIEKLPQLLAAYAAEHASWFDGEPMAGMFGTDHMAPRADLADVLRRYADENHDIRLSQCTLGEVIARRDHSADALSLLPRVVGEMRSAARGNVLPGVLSIRTNLKQAVAAAERRLTIAERLDALLGQRPVRAMFDRAWNLVVQSTAHDSALGCGVDATADQVENRLRIASHSADGVIDMLLPSLRRYAPRGDLAVFNPCGWAKTVLAEHVVEMAPDELPTSAQLVEAQPTVIGDEYFSTEDLPRIVRRIHGQELFGKHIRGWSWEGDELEFVVADLTDDDFDLAEFVAVMHQKMATAPDHRWHVTTRVPPSSRVLLGLPLEGMSIGAVGVESVVLPEHTVRSADGGLTNGLVSARITAEGGLSIEDHSTGRQIRDALKLVDDGDRGDSYNFGPTQDAPVTMAITVAVNVEETGPWRGRIRWTRELDLPIGLHEDDRSRRSATMVAQRVDTIVELRADEPFVRVTIEVTNRVRDHRLRVLVPTGVQAVERSWSAGQYGVTERSRTAEGGWGEYPIPTFPATRVIGAGQTHVLLDKLVEYEIVDGEPDQIALTVLRAVGLMSVNVHPYRDEPAGSELPAPGAQYLDKPVAFRFAIDLTADQWSESDVVRHSDQFRLEPVTIPGAGGDVPPIRHYAVRGRVALESLRRVGDAVEARFVNYQRQPELLKFDGGPGWSVTDMTGAGDGVEIDTAALSVSPGQILTLRREPQ